MKNPVRMQMKRIKGFRLQEESQKINGLPAVLVSRPSKWGNYVGLDKYEAAIRQLIDNHYSDFDIAELKGKNLACWCRVDQECHADILLKIANEKVND